MEFGDGWIGGWVRGQVTSKRKEMRGKRPKGTSWFVLLDYTAVTVTVTVTVHYEAFTSSSTAPVPSVAARQVKVAQSLLTAVSTSLAE